MDKLSAAFLHYLELEMLDGSPAPEKVACLVLNRPQQANAFSGALLLEITQLLKQVAQDPSIRLLLIQGAGKHFSAGADLNWMQEAARLDFAANCQEAEKLTHMFESLAQLSIPTLALAKGAAFGGAVGLIAACDYAFALEQARFCLSEAKIGLIPAVILPYLARKIPAGQLHRQTLTARIFTAPEALQLGLIQGVVDPESVEAMMREEINLLLSASPEAQSRYKALHRHLSTSNWQQCRDTVEAIAETRASPMGQAGLHAFFQKTSAPWCRRLSAHATFMPFIRT